MPLKCSQAQFVKSVSMLLFSPPPLMDALGYLCHSSPLALDVLQEEKY